MSKLAVITGTMIFLAAGAASAQQSLGDKPLEINGTTRVKTVYTFTGAVDSATQATFIACTSTQKTGGKNIAFAVEFFANGSLRNDISVGEGDANVSPSDTDAIASRSVANLSELSIVTPPNSGGLLSGRIVAESTKLICAAYIVDVATGEYRSSVPLFRKLKQSGA